MLEHRGRVARVDRLQQGDAPAGCLVERAQHAEAAREAEDRLDFGGLQVGAVACTTSRNEATQRPCRPGQPAASARTVRAHARASRAPAGVAWVASSRPLTIATASRAAAARFTCGGCVRPSRPMRSTGCARLAVEQRQRGVQCVAHLAQLEDLVAAEARARRSLVEDREVVGVRGRGAAVEERAQRARPPPRAIASRSPKPSMPRRFRSAATSGYAKSFPSSSGEPRSALAIT
jgi:hypothetical protein